MVGAHVYFDSHMNTLKECIHSSALAWRSFFVVFSLFDVLKNHSQLWETCEEHLIGNDDSSAFPLPSNQARGVCAEQTMGCENILYHKKVDVQL